MGPGVAEQQGFATLFYSYQTIQLFLPGVHPGLSFRPFSMVQVPGYCHHKLPTFPKLAMSLHIPLPRGKTPFYLSSLCQVSPHLSILLLSWSELELVSLLGLTPCSQQNC